MKDAIRRLVIIDTPSGLSGITREVMLRSTHLLSPLQAEPVALRSFDQLLQMVGGTEVIWIGLSAGATASPPGMGKYFR